MNEKVMWDYDHFTLKELRAVMDLVEKICKYGFVGLFESGESIAELAYEIKERERKNDEEE